MMEYLNELRKSKVRKMGVLREMHKNIQDMYEIQVGMGKLAKDERRWV